tara:strand:+ start:1425 stop:1757 length:333 start_codon:yes stop_codon:yes gene_type:complete
MAIVANLMVDQGTDFETTIDIAGADGNPVDLTGYVIAGQVRKAYTSSTAHNFVASVTVPTSGTVNIQLTNASTSNMKAGRYVYDVEMTSPSGVKTRVIEGILEITAEVTR